MPRRPDPAEKAVLDALKPLDKAVSSLQREINNGSLSPDVILGTTLGPIHSRFRKSKAGGKYHFTRYSDLPKDHTLRGLFREEDLPRDNRGNRVLVLWSGPSDSAPKGAYSLAGVVRVTKEFRDAQSK